MRQTMNFVLSLTALLLALGAGLAKDPDPPDKTEPKTEPEKKRSFERILGRNLDEWTKLLRSPDASLRREAVGTIPFYGADASDAVPNLIHILGNDPDAPLRANAAIALMNIEVRNSQVPSVVEALAKQLEINLQTNVRFHCAATLGRFEDEAAKAIPVLIMRTRDPVSWEVRMASCYSLSRVFADPKKLAPDSRSYMALIAALSDPASKVRMEALQGLLNFGVPGDRMLRNALIAGLLKLMNDREKSISVVACVGLMLNDKVDPIYLNALSKMLREGDVPTKIQVVRAFGMLIRELKTDELQKKIPEIVVILKDTSNDPALIGTACWTLVNINEKLRISEDAISAIKAVADNKDEKLEQFAKEAAKNAHAALTKKAEKPVKVEKGDRR